MATARVFDAHPPSVSPLICRRWAVLWHAQITKSLRGCHRWPMPSAGIDRLSRQQKARRQEGRMNGAEHQTAVRDPEGVSCTCEYFNSAVAMATCLTSQPLLQRAPLGRTYSYMRTYIFIYCVSSRLPLMYFSVFCPHAVHLALH